jgi:hypothetical protein
MLYFNDETGEWYTLGADTPLDAFGNPINASDAVSTSVGSPGFIKALTDMFTGSGSGLSGGNLLGLAGLAALMNKIGGGSGGGSGYSGYQGGIPTYTASRSQTPAAQQRPTTQTAGGATVPYRPGQGGISYFTPMTYTPAATTTPAAGTNTDTTTSGAAAGGMMKDHGIAMLAEGGRFLRGPGDGVSDSIPATIGQRQPARLADGEFVIDARTVSEIGNGSSEAGARKLYAMMDRVQRARKKATRGKPSGADKLLPK